ncbi:MAG: serine/threonine-protein phosphatase [Gemmatimonadota bacterium]|nr:MAG: serine/threonine-protein phosphatase [Gemmatimonadota bacterium]
MADPNPKPTDQELDVFGLTHRGKVRKENQDHFLICTLHKQMRIHGTSLPHPEHLAAPSERLAFLAVVADGVGGHLGGEEASRLTLEAVAGYLTNSMHCYYTHDPEQESEFLEQLQSSVLESHQKVTAEAEADPARKGMASTLTLAIAVWPWAYVVHVGDSRCYQLREGGLIQITRDQTVGQALYDEGLLDTAEAMESKWSHVLASAIGGPEANPVTSRVALHRDDVLLLCSDGLSGYVSDEQIRERLLTMKSAKQACHALVEDALEGGGGDNVTVVVGRAPSRR